MVTTPQAPALPGGQRPNRIILIVADYVPALGGTTTQTRLQARELVRRGADVTILTRRTTFGQSHALVDGIPVRRVALPGQGALAKLPTMLLMWWWLLRRRRAISAVNVLMDPDFALCAWAAGLGRSTVLTWASLRDPTRSLTGPKGRFRLRLLRTATQVALTSEMQRELLDLSVAPVHVIAVPVDLSRFQAPTEDERVRARLDAGIDTQRVIVFVGHVREQKGVAHLVEAIKDLRDQGLDVVLLVVGGPLGVTDHEYLRDLENYVAAHRLADAVRFVGPQPDVRPFLYAGDVFCLPSEREGMPNVLLEAMACGLPCVAPPSAGGMALLADGAGCIPASNSHSDLAGAIAEVLQDDHLRETIRRDAFDRVRTCNSVERIIDQYEALFRA